MAEEGQAGSSGKRTAKPPAGSTALAPHSLEADLRDMASDFEAFSRRVERALSSAWTETFSPAVRTPRLDIEDAAGEYRVRLDLPGVGKDGLDIRATERSVTIQAEVGEHREVTEGDYLYRERNQRAFRRHFEVPEPIAPGKVEAELKDGVLTLRLPKLKPTASTRVPVR